MADTKPILVVEDEESSANLLFDILTHEGYKVEVATNTGEATQKLTEAGPYAIVTLDILLEGVQSTHLVEMFYTNPNIQSAPVLIVSGLEQHAEAFKGTIETFKRLGVIYEVVEKPFAPIEVSEKVRDLLHRSAP